MKESFFSKSRKWFSSALHDLWRVTLEEESGGILRIFRNVARTIVLASRGFSSNRLFFSASGLTYFTALAFIPFVSVVLAISKGFGAEGYIQSQLLETLPEHGQLLDMVFSLVGNVLSTATNGVVMGIGIVFIIWAMWAIFNNIERSFNAIWEIPVNRKFYRKLTDMLAICLLLPILLILLSGLNIFLKTYLQNSPLMALAGPLLTFLFKLAPFLFSFLLFTLLYIWVPNTKVKFRNAAIAGLLSGIAFQIFQNLWLSGQIFISRYNAYYGSFAAIPLFLLWLQVTWIIILFGAEITFASQNISNYMYEKEAEGCSSRCKMFVHLLTMSLICKRFADGGKPYSASDITLTYHIPIRLTLRSLNKLLAAGLINEVMLDEEKGEIRYQPAVDINRLTAGYVYKACFEDGNEAFNIDTDKTFAPHWQMMEQMYGSLLEEGDKTLLKDLEVK